MKRNFAAGLVLIVAMVAFAPAVAAPMEGVRIYDHAAGKVMDLPFGMVMAQAEAPAPSVLEGLLKMALTPEGFAIALTALGTIIGLIWGGRALAYKRRLALGIYHVFHIVNDIDAEKNDETLDKAVAALGALNEYMILHGWRQLKPHEEKLARLGFQSLHGQEKQAVKMAAESQLLAEQMAYVPGK